MRFYVVGHTPETSQYPGNVTFFCYDEAGHLIEKFDFIQPEALFEYKKLDYTLCHPFRMAATQDGFIYSINTFMSVQYDPDNNELYPVTVRNESVSKYDCNGFKRAFSVDFRVYPRVPNTYSVGINRLTAIAVSGNNQILIGMQTDEDISESTYNTYLISVDAAGNTEWSLTAPTPPYYLAGEYAEAFASYHASNPTLNPIRLSVIDIVADDSGYLYILTWRFLEKRNSSGVLQWRRWLNTGASNPRISIIGGELYIMVDADFYYDVDGYTRINYLPPESYGYAKITKWSCSDGALIGFETNKNLFGSDSSEWYLRTEYGAAGGINLYALNTAYYELDDSPAVTQSVNYHSVTAKYASPGRLFRIASDGTLFSTKESYEPNPIVVSADPTTENWSVAISANPTSGANYKLSCCALIEDEWLPPIPIPIACGVPGYTGDRYAAIQGLPISIGASAPRFVSDPQIASSAYSVIRMILDDGHMTLELPLSSVSVRYYSTGVSISAVSPKVTTAVVTAIDAMSNDCEIIIRRGVGYPNGDQVLSELARGALDKNNLRFDIGGKHASITLPATGEAEPPYNSRTLLNISYRAEINGKRRVRCQLDTYLRPGGAAQISDSESMIVGSITYTASTSQEFMEVEEAS